ncbi:CIA30-domain-containing protein [Zalerion maritima]|uniref:CIA30-domain-containing protein n=1 Tax=Zalerion maritima TaxID=339359 RepID=A0AAD5RIS7_9PEZI|nr:CIA30-domain-containing protein [Zalerion maritima]
MRATPALYRANFWARSYAELKRTVNFVVTKEGITGAKKPFLLHSFNTPESVSDDLKTLSDQNIGGSSTSHVDWVGPTAESNYNAYARFHGNISRELPPDPKIMRTGYAAFRTRDRGPTIFGKSLWNMDPYAFLALRVKSDGRSYLVNIQTDGVVDTDLHQHRLFVTRPGEWETVILKWNDFVRTNYGFVVEPQMEMLKQKIKSIGIGLTDRVEGPYELCIEKIWATNRYDDLGVELPKHDRNSIESVNGHGDVGGSIPGGLKNKKGEHIQWQGVARR